MICNNCGNQNISNASFCTKCGRKLEPDSTENQPQQSPESSPVSTDSSWQQQYGQQVPPPVYPPQQPQQQPNQQGPYQQQPYQQPYRQNFAPQDPNMQPNDYIVSPLAGIGSRILALLLDWLIVGVVVGVPMTVLEHLTGGGRRFQNPADVGISVVNLISMVAIIAYMTFFECSKYQATLGKMALKIKVVNSHGQRMSFGNSLGRNAFKHFFGWCCCFIDFFWALFNDERKTLHDLVASTSVVDCGDVSYRIPPSEQVPPEYYSQQQPPPY